MFQPPFLRIAVISPTSHLDDNIKGHLDDTAESSWRQCKVILTTTSNCSIKFVIQIVIHFQNLTNLHCRKGDDNRSNRFDHISNLDSQTRLADIAMFTHRKRSRLECRNRNSERWIYLALRTWLREWLSLITKYLPSLWHRSFRCTGYSSRSRRSSDLTKRSNSARHWSRWINHLLTTISELDMMNNWYSLLEKIVSSIIFDFQWRLLEYMYLDNTDAMLDANEDHMTPTRVTWSTQEARQQNKIVKELRPSYSLVLCFADLI